MAKAKFDVLPTFPETLQRDKSYQMNRTIMPELVEEEEEVVDEKQLKTLMTIVPIVVPILFTFVIVIGLVGNLLVVLVVLLNKTMRNTTNILIFNLAVSHIFKILPPS